MKNNKIKNYHFLLFFSMLILTSISANSQTDCDLSEGEKVENSEERFYSTDSDKEFLSADVLKDMRATLDNLKLELETKLKGAGIDLDGLNDTEKQKLIFEKLNELKDPNVKFPPDKVEFNGAAGIALLAFQIAYDEYTQIHRLETEKNLSTLDKVDAGVRIVPIVGQLYSMLYSWADTLAHPTPIKELMAIIGIAELVLAAVCPEVGLPLMALTQLAMMIYEGLDFSKEEHWVSTMKERVSVGNAFMDKLINDSEYDYSTINIGVVPSELSQKQFDDALASSLMGDNTNKLSKEDAKNIEKKLKDPVWRKKYSKYIKLKFNKKMLDLINLILSKSDFKMYSPTQRLAISTLKKDFAASDLSIEYLGNLILGIPTDTTKTADALTKNGELLATQSVFKEMSAQNPEKLKKIVANYAHLEAKNLKFKSDQIKFVYSKIAKHPHKKDSQDTFLKSLTDSLSNAKHVELYNKLLLTSAKKYDELLFYGLRKNSYHAHFVNILYTIHLLRRTAFVNECARINKSTCETSSFCNDLIKNKKIIGLGTDTNIGLASDTEWYHSINTNMSKNVKAIYKLTHALEDKLKTLTGKDFSSKLAINADNVHKDFTWFMQKVSNEDFIPYNPIKDTRGKSQESSKMKAQFKKIADIVKLETKEHLTANSSNYKTYIGDYLITNKEKINKQLYNTDIPKNLLSYTKLPDMTILKGSGKEPNLARSGPIQFELLSTLFGDGIKSVELKAMSKYRYDNLFKISRPKLKPSEWNLDQLINKYKQINLYNRPTKDYYVKGYQNIIGGLTVKRMAGLSKVDLRHTNNEVNGPYPYTERQAMEIIKALNDNKPLPPFANSAHVNAHRLKKTSKWVATNNVNSQNPFSINTLSNLYNKNLLEINVKKSEEVWDGNSSKKAFYNPKSSSKRIEPFFRPRMLTNFNGETGNLWVSYEAREPVDLRWRKVGVSKWNSVSKIPMGHKIHFPEKGRYQVQIGAQSVSWSDASVQTKYFDYYSLSFNLTLDHKGFSTLNFSTSLSGSATIEYKTLGGGRSYHNAKVGYKKFLGTGTHIVKLKVGGKSITQTYKLDYSTRVYPNFRLHARSNTLKKYKLGVNFISNNFPVDIRIYPFNFPQPSDGFWQEWGSISENGKINNTLFILNNIDTNIRDYYKYESSLSKLSWSHSSVYRSKIYKSGKAFDNFINSNKVKMHVDLHPGGHTVIYYEGTRTEPIDFRYKKQGTNYWVLAGYVPFYYNIYLSPGNYEFELRYQDVSWDDSSIAKKSVSISGSGNSQFNNSAPVPFNIIKDGNAIKVIQDTRISSLKGAILSPNLEVRLRIEDPVFEYPYMQNQYTSKVFKNSTYFLNDAYKKYKAKSMTYTDFLQFKQAYNVVNSVPFLVNAIRRNYNIPLVNIRKSFMNYSIQNASTVKQVYKK